jgi:hypothetical protein
VAFCGSVDRADASTDRLRCKIDAFAVIGMPAGDKIALTVASDTLREIV